MTDNVKRFTVPIIEVDGDLAVEFPDELMDNVGWKVGDTIQWDIQPDGLVVISKKETK